MGYLCCYAGVESQALLAQRPVCIAVVGDPGCGKTSLIYRFSRDYLPPVGPTESASLDTDRLDIVHSGRHIKLTLYDVSGHEEDARVRALAYSMCDVIILCFPLDSPEAHQRIISDWAPEVTYLNKGKPFLLIGTKADLRETGQKGGKPTADFVSKSLGRKTARLIGAKKYLECSVLGPDSVKATKTIFGRAIREGLKSNRWL